ncbi:MAG: hypothetical protein KDD62_13285, partial [Bdellovibrionales bacterium]|nr:hypothetical protein [Bdellovibrionales bacterium]
TMPPARRAMSLPPRRKPGTRRWKSAPSTASATHLLLKALQIVLSPEIHQRGSNITPKRLRFDFNFDRALTAIEIQEIETLVNQFIAENLIVSSQEMSKHEAKQQGVEGMFWERYPDRVTVYQMTHPVNKEVVSQEVCGGPHVECTGQLTQRGRFTISKQESVGNGLRRMKATFNS